MPLPPSLNSGAKHFPKFSQRTFTFEFFSKNWESFGGMEIVNDMSVQFSKLVNNALDEVAPFKSFSNKTGYKATSWTTGLKVILSTLVNADKLG